MKALGATMLSLLLALLCIQKVNLLWAEATSILRPGDQLDWSWNLVSDGGKFTLGFFTIRETTYSYLGIWYTYEFPEKKVWVGNPNTPLINNSGVLTIDSSGALKITNAGNTIVNISGHVGTSNTTAVLKDSGNFVLMDAVHSRTLWQSFDHPTSILLPGMRLNFNLTTGRAERTLTSWLSYVVPASGAFTLGLETIQGSGQLVIRRRGELYWTSGPWNGESFQFVPQLTRNFHMYQYSLNYPSNNQMFVSFNTIGKTVSMLELDPDGKIYDAANNYDLSPYLYFCYGVETENGCVATAQPTCRSSRDKFEIKWGDFPGNPSTYYESSSLSAADCMVRCWKDCSCVGFTVTSNGTGCIVWSGYGEFRENERGNTIGKGVLVKGKSSTVETPSVATKSVTAKSRIWIIIGSSVFAVLLVSSLLGYLIMRRRHKLQDEKRRRREEFLHLLTATDSFNDGNQIEHNRQEPQDLKMFSFESITVATDNFSIENKLGEGGFGPVYKGRLPNGREIAVKRLSRTSGQGVQEFKNELILISKLQHANLVRVFGCCIYQEEKMLIYEFMPNKSLDFFLFAPDRKERLLNWQTRFGIMEGVAQGLVYLHKYSRMRVIHRDLKASNVLLDEHMHPKIADFGMARIFQQNESKAITNRLAGTYGYMSPEYAMEGTFSIKSDVFSFGILVLEIVSGRKNTSFCNLDHPLTLIGYAWELWKAGNALDLKDPLLGDSCDMNQILRAIHVGLLCVQENAIDRPKMQGVILMLNSENMPLPSPKQPAFFTGRNTLESTLAEDKAKGKSVQDCSITEVEAR